MKVLLPLAPQYKPVSLANLHIRLYYSGMGNQYYSALAHTNGLVLFETDRNLFLFYRRIYNAIKTTQASLKPYILSQKAVVKPGPAGLGKYFSLSEVSLLSEALSEIEAYRSAVAEDNKRRGLISTNRKPVFFFLELSPAWKKELADSLELRRRLTSLLSESSAAGVFVWVVARTAIDLHDGLLRSFDYSVFLGDENSAKARDIYRELEEKPYDEKRKIVGLLQDKSLNDLRPIHHVSAEKSEFKDINDKIDEIEEEAYRMLLESLE